MARAPLRDGLPQGGHRAAGDGPARPARRVPARGLPALAGDERVGQGGVRRAALPRRRQGRRAAARPRRSSRSTSRRCSGRWPARATPRAGRPGRRRRRSWTGGRRAEPIGEGAPHVEVSGVGVGRPRTGALHYSAPTETGEVEVRDERGAGTATLTEDAAGDDGRATRRAPAGRARSSRCATAGADGPRAGQPTWSALTRHRPSWPTSRRATARTRGPWMTTTARLGHPVGGFADADPPNQRRPAGPGTARPSARAARRERPPPRDDGVDLRRGPPHHLGGGRALAVITSTSACADLPGPGSGSGRSLAEVGCGPKTCASVERGGRRREGPGRTGAPVAAARGRRTAGAGGPAGARGGEGRERRLAARNAAGAGDTARYLSRLPGSPAPGARSTLAREDEVRVVRR